LAIARPHNHTVNGREDAARATSNVLLQLTEKLKELEAQIASSSEQLEGAKDERSRILGRIDLTRETRAETTIVLQTSSSDEFEKRFPKLEELCLSLLKEQPFRVETATQESATYALRSTTRSNFRTRSSTI